MSRIIQYYRNKILVILCIISLSLAYTSYAMYNGSVHWHPPKKLTCYGIKDFPNGMQVSTHADQVYGMSLDAYIFPKMDGALGIYYFDLELQNPYDSNHIKGIVTYIRSTDWKTTKFEINCVVEQWH